MIIEEITLRNWRGYREEHTFQFDEGFNLLLGRNEAGKSTLFEALTRVLFDRHTSTAKEISQIQPVGSSLAPEATLIFQSTGERYKIFKRFLKNATSELYISRNDRWQRNHEGDDADTTLREILRGESAGRASKPEHRGLCQALWYLQTDEPLPKDEWAGAIRIGLSGFISHIAQSPDEERILKEIGKEFSKYYTPNDKIKKGSPSSKLEGEIGEIEEEFLELKERSDKVDSQRSDLEAMIEEKRTKEAAFKGVKSEIDALKTKVAEGAALEDRLRQKEDEINQTQEEKKRLTRDYDTINRRRKNSDEAQKELEMEEKEAERLQSDARIEQQTAKIHAANWKDTLDPELQQTEQHLSFLRSIEQLALLNKERRQIQADIEKIKSVEEAIRDTQSILLEETLPDKKDWQKFQKQRDELNSVTAQAEISGIWIGFDLKSGDTAPSVEPDPESRNEDGEYLILRPTRFTMGDVGVVSVRGGGSSLEELQKKAKSLTDQIQATFRRFSVEDEEGLNELLQRHGELERELKRLQKDLDTLAGEDDLKSLQDNFKAIEQKIRVKKSECAAAPPEWSDLSQDVIQERIKELEKEKRRLSKEIKIQQKKEEEAQVRGAEWFQNAQSAANRVIELKTLLKTLERENSQILQSYGTIEHLEQLIEDLAARLKQTEVALSSILDEYRIQVEEPKRELAMAEKTLEALDKQLQDIILNITGIKASMETVFAQNLYSGMADREALLEVRRKQLDRANRQAESIQLLKNMAEAFQKEQSTALSGPVASLLNEWLATLTNDSYDAIRMNEHLIPLDLQTSRSSEVLPMECLSYGTREQVVVLLRLAIGVLLSRDERNLVVIDDRLVNADPIRMRRLCQILDEVATGHCQIVVATCNDTPYAGIKGNTISVPGETSK